MAQILWTPSDEALQHSHMANFMAFVNQRYQQHFNTYPALYDWSIHHLSEFWQSIWDFCAVIGNLHHTPVMEKTDKIPGVKWFPKANLNFAANLLWRRDNHPALRFYHESGHQKTLSYHQLYEKVIGLATFFSEMGIAPGMRIAAFLPNCPETIIAMLATTAIGAIWSSCSPDFGVPAALDRFKQIEPTVLIGCDGYRYNGKPFQVLDKVNNLVKALPTVAHTLIVPYLSETVSVDNFKSGHLFDDCLLSPEKAFNFAPFPFAHPLAILFSSGTTGKPKCITHSIGGTLLQHKKELMLHCDCHQEDSLFYFTTCSWMMWNWLVSGLSLGTTLVLYDGNPTFPKPDKLFQLIDDADISHFGVSAKYLGALEKMAITPKNHHHLRSLKTIFSAGSPLAPYLFDYVMDAIKPTVQLASISGGTDLISCFALGNPLLPVKRGMLQCRGLGMAVNIYNEKGEAILDEKGELVCEAPFPSMPLYFWGDHTGKKYHEAYFNRFPHVWAHGDHACLTPDGDVIIYGRSDTVLNPGGVRIGTAEIYRLVEKMPAIEESLAVGYQKNDDEVVLLFVVCKEGKKLDDALKAAINSTLKEKASFRHVPYAIYQVPALPKTHNGKIAEMAVRQAIHGAPIGNENALANPDSLAYFKKVMDDQG